MKPSIERFSALIDAGYEPLLAPILDRYEQKALLPKLLQDKLDSIGDTPIAEPKIFEAINSGDITAVALSVLSEDEIKTFTAIEVGNFLRAVEVKVMDHRLPDGTFKATPNTENCRLPNFLETDKIRKGFTASNELMQQWIATPEGPDKEKLALKLGEESVELDAYLMGISGLDPEILTDWEKGLVIAMMAGVTMDAFLSSQGKPYRR